MVVGRRGPLPASAKTVVVVGHRDMRISAGV